MGQLKSVLGKMKTAKFEPDFFSQFFPQIWHQVGALLLRGVGCEPLKAIDTPLLFTYAVVLEVRVLCAVVK